MTQRAVIYGSSLYDLATEENLAEVIWEEMNAVRQIMRENPDYMSLLSNASLSKQERTALLQEAFGEQVQKYLLNFLKILCERDLLGEFGGCCEEYRKRYYRDHNMVEAIITSAVALTREQLRALQTKLEAVTGKTVVPVQKVDTGLVGGVRVEMEGKMLDGSVQSRLQGLSRKLNETII